MARLGHIYRLDGREDRMMFSALLQSGILLMPLWATLRNKLSRPGWTTCTAR